MQFVAVGCVSVFTCLLENSYGNCVPGSIVVDTGRRYHHYYGGMRGECRRHIIPGMNMSPYIRSGTSEKRLCKSVLFLALIWEVPDSKTQTLHNGPTPDGICCATDSFRLFRSHVVTGLSEP